MLLTHLYKKALRALGGSLSGNARQKDDNNIANVADLEMRFTPAHPRQRTRDEAAALREIDAIYRRVSSRLASFLAPDPD